MRPSLEKSGLRRLAGSTIADSWRSCPAEWRHGILTMGNRGEWMKHLLLSDARTRRRAADVWIGMGMRRMTAIE